MIAPTTYLGNWAFVTSIIVAKFMVDQPPFLFEVCPNFIMFQPWGECLAYSLTNLPNLSIIFPNFFTMFWTWLGLPHPSIAGFPDVCARIPSTYGYPSFMLCP